MRLMADERIYRHDNVTIGTLATKLAIPEYRLRRLINQRLGYRNFNVFLNNHRIEEAKAALADPTRPRCPSSPLRWTPASSRSAPSTAPSRPPPG